MCKGTDLRYSLYHVQSHLDTAHCVVWPWLRKSAHAVVAVPEQLDPQAVIFGGQLVKAGEKLVQDLDYFFRCALGRETSEAADVSE